MMALPSSFRFLSETSRREFIALQNGDDADRRLYEWIYSAGMALERNAFAGTQIRKALIPKEYARHDIDNLWKYDLPDGWRLVYTIKSEEVVIITIVLEWLDHKDYERRFKY
jgi:hypothetical protein